ncbi:uncharacterized protein PHALS_00659 [Plasmopara halstedii]|uniref:Uncharacterized protein n=1 Tax=Plasmopara halstedii TaxID=4781 RepID=A0A0P1B910_PLAHL|nr:uncharacterized protein PHALS_00659 [Plasmopara halstedii]CEG50521.1 hypothetical protein PHALS_00659 [Plasmopara halstedii]|eukprot:XP_024586890.1 hypothetical protein PHALS_00659 [Plasmopara halstedii]
MGTRSRTLKYLPGHELRFGIAAVSHDESTGEVDEAVCLFCQHFGREQRAEKKRKCASTIKYFRDSFRPDQYTQHHQLQHPTQWLKYKDLSDSDKYKFFSSTTESAVTDTKSNICNRTDEVLIPEIHERGRCFDIMASIVEIVAVMADGMGPVEPTVYTRDRLMYQYMTHHNYEGELPSNCPRWCPPPNTFEECYVIRAEPPVYRVVLYAKTQLDFVMELAKEGLSGAQISASLQTCKLYAPLLLNDVVKSPMEIGPSCTSSEAMTVAQANEKELKKSCVNENMTPEYNEAQTTEFTRFGIAVCLNILSKLLEESWGFSLEFCTVAHHPQFSYLDVRVRFYNRIGGLRSAHLVAIPECTGRCDKMIIKTLNRVLTTVHPHWRTKLLGVTTTGVLPFPFRLNEVVEHFQHAAKGSVLYRSSNCISQLQHILHTFCTSIDNGNFLQMQKKLSEYVRKDHRVSSKIKKDPTFREQLDAEVYRASSPPMAFGREINMFVTHSLFLQEHLKDSKSPSNPSIVIPVSWWVELQVLQWILIRAHAVYEVLMKHYVTIDQQANVMASLAGELITSLHAQIYKDPKSIPQLSFVDYISLDNRVALSKTHTEEFVLKASELARNLVKQDGNTIVRSTAESFATGAANMIAALVELSVSLKQQCAACTIPTYGAATVVTEVLPPVMPHELALLSLDEFEEMLKPFETSLLGTLTKAEIKVIQEEHKLFRQAFALDENLRCALEMCTPETPFRVAWNLMDARFDSLEAFAGGVATVWPSLVVPVADRNLCDFVLCIKQMEEARLMLSDFELESTLHAQQFQSLMLLREQLYERDIDRWVNRKRQKMVNPHHSNAL